MSRYQTRVVMLSTFLWAGAAAAEPNWFAQAQLTPEGAATGACSRELRLGVDGDALKIGLQAVPGQVCEGTPEPRTFNVTVVRFENGIKTYEAEGASGRLTLTDQRGPDGEPAWRAVIQERPFPSKDSQRFIAGKVEDKNLKPSGTQSFDLIVWLTQPLSPRDVRLLCYSLMLDAVDSVPVNPARPKAYQLRVVSDLPLAQVIAQLKALELVSEIAPVVPTP